MLLTCCCLVLTMLPLLLTGAVMLLQICNWDGGDCCASTCKPVTLATYYGLSAADVANITSTNVTTDVTSQLAYSCRRVFTLPLDKFAS